MTLPIIIYDEQCMVDNRKNNEHPPLLNIINFLKHHQVNVQSLGDFLSEGNEISDNEVYITNERLFEKNNKKMPKLILFSHQISTMRI